MAVIKEKYSPDGINRIYQLLKNEADSETPKDYEVKIDMLAVIGRTNDPERFFEHEAFLLDNSKSITINIFDGLPSRCTKYIFVLSEEAPAKEGLYGIEQTLQVRMQQERKSWEYDRQKKKVQQLTQELADSERYVKQLQDKIRSMNGEKQNMPGILTEAFLSVAGVIASNGFSGSSILGALAGSPKPSDETSEYSAEPEIEATFSKVEPEPVYTGTPTEVDAGRFSKALIPLFPEEYREKVSEITRYMCYNHHLIDELYTQLEANGHVARAAA